MELLQSSEGSTFLQKLMKEVGALSIPQRHFRSSPLFCSPLPVSVCHTCTLVWICFQQSIPMAQAGELTLSHRSTYPFTYKCRELEVPRCFHFKVCMMFPWSCAGQLLSIKLLCWNDTEIRLILTSSSSLTNFPYSSARFSYLTCTWVPISGWGTQPNTVKNSQPLQYSGGHKHLSLNKTHSPG